MTTKFAAAFALVVALPLAAHAQAKPTKAEVQKLVSGIQGDKSKTQKYCDMMKLYDEAAAADEKKDQKKVEELNKKAEAAAKDLGPDYEKVMNGLQQVDPSSDEGKELSAALDPLDNACGGK